MSNEYPQPVEPMSRAEAILRGDDTVFPMSRIEDLLKQLIEGGGGGSTISITTEYSTGTKVATFDVDGTDIDLYIPTDQIGSIVSISTDYQTGTKIATLTIDQQDYNIYIPSVTVTPVVESGTKIATINGTDIFAPADQVGAKTYVGITDPDASLGANGDLYFKGTRATGTMVAYDGTFALGTGTSSGGGVEVPLDHLIGDAVSLEIVWSNNNLERTRTAPVEAIPISVGGSMSQGSWTSDGDGNYYLQLVRDAAGKLYAKVHAIAFGSPYISKITATGPYGDVQTITAGYLKADGAWKKYTTDVAVSQVVSSGVKIATITINNSPVDIYAPEDIVGAKTYKDVTDPDVSLGVDGDLYFKLHRSDTQVEHDFTPAWLPINTWNVVDNPYYEDFCGYKGTIAFQSSTQSISKSTDEIPIYDSTVQSNPENYKFWEYSYLRWCTIARSADNKKLYFYNTTDNATFSNQKVITSGMDSYTDIFIKHGGVWLPLHSTQQ